MQVPKILKVKDPDALRTVVASAVVSSANLRAGSIMFLNSSSRPWRRSYSACVSTTRSSPFSSTGMSLSSSRTVSMMALSFSSVQSSIAVFSVS